MLIHGNQRLVIVRESRTFLNTSLTPSRSADAIWLPSQGRVVTPSSGLGELRISWHVICLRVGMVLLLPEFRFKQLCIIGGSLRSGESPSSRTGRSLFEPGRRPARMLYYSPGAAPFESPAGALLPHSFAAPSGGPRAGGKPTASAGPCLVHASVYPSFIPEIKEAFRKDGPAQPEVLGVQN